MIVKKCGLLLTAAMAVATAKADNITFADANVKALCVANWDTNYDGELSTDEAAAVTSFGTVFKGNKDITTFDEMRYFTGVTVIGEQAFYNSSITRITIPAGVTEIAMYAFYKSRLTGEVVIPGNVKVVRAYAFLECTLMTRVVLEEGVEQIGTEAFNGPISYLSLPTTITDYGWDGVNPYMSHGFEDRDYEFYLFARSTTPVPANSYAFHCLYGEGVLVVPFGCVDVYSNTSPWSVFYKTLEIGDVNRDEVLDDADLEAIISYLDGTEPEGFYADMADINGDGDVDKKDFQLLRNYLYPPTYLLGDTNGDGVVNVQDQINLITYLLGRTTEVFIQEAADVNGDRAIDTLDAIGIIEIILGRR